MSRKEEIERIIIGTLLNNRDVLNDCTGSISPDMFSDEKNRRIYEKIIEMRNSIFCEINPYSLLCFDRDMLGLADYMCELATGYDFEVKKLRYNLNLYYYSTDKYPKYTTVTFSDYITRFIKLYVESLKA